MEPQCGFGSVHGIYLEATLENSLWRKNTQMQPMLLYQATWGYILKCIQEKAKIIATNVTLILFGLWRLDQK